jgi:ADP-heptose:LPS heptosyltransferase
MGLGDNLLASGLARGASVRGKRIAFGDGKQIFWDHYSDLIFRNNPNIAPRNATSFDNAEWIPFYRGNRIYNKPGDGRWIWNYDFRAMPGEMFFAREELAFAKTQSRGFVIIEPNVPGHKSVASNKQWGFDKYNEVAQRLAREGHRVLQFVHAGATQRLTAAKHAHTPNFRLALALMQRADLYIGPEGGLHHGAAAVGIPAVVLFGGFIPPQVTGYPTHANLTGGAEACGFWKPCPHCATAMKNISVDEVMTQATRLLRKAA